MKPSSFDLFQPQDWSETLNALKNYDKDAMILAGGQSLIAMMNMRIAKPKVLIDINTIKELFSHLQVKCMGCHLINNLMNIPPIWLLALYINHVGFIQFQSNY